MLRFLKVFLLSLITIALVAFAIANRDIVTVSLFPLPYTLELPKFLLALICLSLGVVLAGLVMSLKMVKVRHRYASERKKVMALENEVKGMQAEQQANLRAVTHKP
jgi:lipopolysaccharide assembly protein A